MVFIYIWQGKTLTINLITRSHATTSCHIILGSISSQWLITNKPNTSFPNTNLQISWLQRELIGWFTWTFVRSEVTVKDSYRCTCGMFVMATVKSLVYSGRPCARLGTEVNNWVNNSPVHVNGLKRPSIYWGMDFKRQNFLFIPYVWKKKIFIIYSSFSTLLWMSFNVLQM